MAMVLMKNSQQLKNSFDIIENPTELKTRAYADGYLFMKELLSPKKILKVREELLQIANKHNLLQAGSNPADGIANPKINYIEANCKEWEPYYKDIQSCRSFHNLAHDQTILHLCESIFETKVLVHPRNISRTIFPHLTRYTTPPHQDHFYINGTANTWTLWVPLGNCDKELGGLALIPGSHKRGKLSVRKADGAGGSECLLTKNEEWLSSEFSAGDVLLFHSHTIHQGLDNKSPNKIRLSCDYRYQPTDEEIDKSSLEPHFNLLDWGSLYKHWPSADGLKYFWKNYPLKITGKE